MKILFIGSGCACRLPFVEYLFKKKIQEAEVPDIEVESADMAMWGVTSHESVVPESSGPDKVGNLLNQADFYRGYGRTAAQLSDTFYGLQ